MRAGGLALFVVAAIALRFVHLDADPHYYGWLGHVMDEGRWVEHSRALAQLGKLFEYPTGNYHFWVSPVFTAATWASFEALSVGRFAARLFPALCGGLLVVLLYAHLRRRVSAGAALLGLAVIAFQADYFVLSRLAVPEMPVALASFVTYLCIVGPGAGALRLFGAGLLACAMVAAKTTSLPLVGIFAAAVFARRSGRVRAGDAERWRDVACYAGGVAAVGALALAASAALGALWQLELQSDINAILNLVKPRYPGQIAKLFVEYPIAPVVNLAVLAIWGGALGALAHDDDDPRRAMAVRVCATWAGLYTLLIFTQRYFPARYVVLILIPVAVLLAVGVERLRLGGATGLAGAMRARSGWRRVLCQALVLLPAVTLVVPAAAALLAELGVPTASLRVRGLLLALAWGLGGAAARRPLESPVWIVRLVAFPVVATLLWLAGWALAPGWLPYWPSQANEFAGHLSSWLLLLAAAAAASGVLAGLLAHSDSAPLRRGLAWGLGLGLSAVWLAHLAPGLLAPRFTVRDTSRELGVLLAEEDIVATANASGLFVDNAVRFRRIDPRRLDAERVLVVASPFADGDILAERYELLRSYPLYVPDAYWQVGCEGRFCDVDALRVDVYRPVPVPPPESAPEPATPDG